MPSIKDFEKKEKKSAKPLDDETVETKKSTGKKRRPGRDPETNSREDVKVVDVETGKTHLVSGSADTPEGERSMDSQQSNKQNEK